MYQEHELLFYLPTITHFKQDEALDTKFFMF